MKILFLAFMMLAASLSSQPINYYFGNLHAHTAFSDGNKDSLSSGVGRPDASYAYAKLSDDFDFLGISEHNHYSSLHNPGFKLPRYSAGIAMADAANADNHFAALFGMEYGISSGHNGHVIIYGFDQLIGWESNVGGQAGNNYEIYNAKGDYEGLFKKVKNNPASFAYLAHPYWTDFTKNGNDSTALAFSAYNAMYDSAIVGMPLRSGNAFSTFTDYSDYSTGDYFNYYKKLLNIGYHLGIGYDHDNHYTNFGRGNGGRLVVLAPLLTRENVISAMQHMHFYGSDDQNATVEFTLNDSIMGSILSGESYPEINLLHNDADGEQADTMRIWRGSKNSGLWAQTLQTTLHSNALLFTDTTLIPGKEYYYFADIKQADGQWIVTSPIWYTLNRYVGVKKNETEIRFTCFPNPASKALQISFSKEEPYAITLADVTGRVVLKNVSVSKDHRLDLSAIAPGLYTIKVANQLQNAVKRVVIE